MLKIKECKALARRTLAGKYKTIIAAWFVNLAISCIMWILTAICAAYALFGAGLFGGGTFSFVRVTAGVMAAIAMTVASLFVGMWFDIGTTKLMLNICRGDKYKISDVFYGFRSGSNTIGYILTGFLIWLITFGINAAARILTTLSALILGSDTTVGISVQLILTTAFVVITVYVVTSLMLAKIIIADKPGTGIGQALEKSRRLMRGRMLKGAWLMYLSFIFWDILTVICGVAALWIIPYVTCTTVIFYMDADGTLWQLPDPDRDRMRGHAAANAAAADTSDTAYPGNGAEETAWTETYDNCTSDAHTDEAGSEQSGSAVNATGSDTADALSGDRTDIGDDRRGEHDEAAAAAEPDQDPAEQRSDAASAGSADNTDSSSESADAPKDSWEKTVSEMHIELPDGFNKTEM